MCEQCVANAHGWIEILPGWQLCRAHKNGNDMKAGQWGLLTCNDPSLILVTDPRTNEHEDCCAYEMFTGLGGVQVYSGIWFSVLKAAKIAGYSDNDGSLESWLMERICKLVKEHLGKVPFPINRSDGAFGVVDTAMEDDLLKYGEVDVYAATESEEEC